MCVCVCVCVHVCVCVQGFLQLDDIGSQHDSHLRIIGGHCEALEGPGIHSCKIKVKTRIMNIHTTQTQLRERERVLPTPEMCFK